MEGPTDSRPHTTSLSKAWAGYAQACFALAALVWLRLPGTTIQGFLQSDDTRHVSDGPLSCNPPNSFLQVEKSRIPCRHSAAEERDNQEQLQCCGQNDTSISNSSSCMNAAQAVFSRP